MADLTAEIPRDRWGRPQIRVPGEVRLQTYLRPSTVAKAPDDTGGLINWASEQTVKGLVARPDLWHLAASGGDTKAIAKQAKEAAASDRQANMGTVLHHWTEEVDKDPAAYDRVPPDLQPYIDVYLEATQHLKVEATELFVVEDELGTAGSLDRLYRMPDGAVCVGDVKTGKWASSYGAPAVAIQTALYAHGQRYDHATGQRTPLHPDLDMDRTVLVHLPLDADPLCCNVHILDGVAGWYGAKIAMRVLGWRKNRDLIIA